MRAPTFSALLLLFCASAWAQQKEKFAADTLAEQQKSLAERSNGFGTRQEVIDSQGASASEISLPAGSVSDPHVRGQLEGLRSNKNTTPAMRQLIDHLLVPQAPASPGAQAQSLNYRQHGYANKDASKTASPNPAAPAAAAKTSRQTRAPAPQSSFAVFQQSRPQDLSAPSRTSYAPAAAAGGAANPGRVTRRSGFNTFSQFSRPGQAGAQPESDVPPPSETETEAADPRRQSTVVESDSAASKDVWALIVSAKAMLKRGDKAGAEAAARTAVRLEPDNSMAHTVLAQALLELGDYEGAARSADAAIHLMSNNAEAFFIRALAHEQLGNQAQKVRDLRIAAALDPARFERFLKDGRPEKRLFDPSQGDSLRLFDTELAANLPEEPRSRPMGAALAALLGALAAAGGFAVYRRKDSLFKRSGRFTLPPLAVPPPKAAAAGPARRLEPGLLLADKHKLVRPFGEDDSEVWRAQDVTLDRPCVLKRLFAGPDKTPERDARLEAARRAATLHHPNVADVFEILDLASGLFLVTEYAPGKSIRQILDEKESLPLDQVRDILVPVCRALEHAHHRGIVHGHLSPACIVVTKQGYIKVSDFATGRARQEGPYAAPETREGKEPAASSDIYSLGVCCFEMLHGKLPEEGDLSTSPYAPLLRHALHPDPRTRLSSGRKFLTMLRELGNPGNTQRGKDTEADA